MHYAAWNERTLMAMLDKRTARSVNAARSVFVVLYAMSANQDDMGVWFGKRLTAALQRPTKAINGLTTVPLHPFALHLFARWRGLPLEYPGSADTRLAVYRGLLDSWDDDRAFADRLVAAADYHVEQAFDDSDDQTQDFFHPLYRLFPVEILAIKRVREEQGRSMPEIDHPLMQTPLAKPPKALPPAEDELLKAVSDKVCKDFAIDDPWK
jgi:hypothetical protein